MSQTGILYLCATPIGNLEDMTFRAVRILKEVNIIAAEDTRQTIKLLNHYDIHTSLTSYHEHNKVEKGKYLVEQLTLGQNIALVTDAGTPGISDPGEDLVKLCIKAGITVTALPGCVAFTTGLICSGMSTKRFCFEGFLSTTKKNRKAHLTQLLNDPRTLIFYEAPHKLTRTLTDLLEAFGDRPVVLARELTKKFEEIKHTTLSQAVAHYASHMPKGEFVIVLEGADMAQLADEQHAQWEKLSIAAHIQSYVTAGLDQKAALKQVANDRGISKREVYQETIKGK
ncbi:MAG: 16S rRNA (cytidine(1402)-2'-O)-methyltransferase [Hyphomonadaceae bacterium]|nr:16S rRNA (cytidine(1402)-2'-O)-methyltransferase [Clostridia bacterium]